MEYYFTYKITNLLDGCFYLGMHSTSNLDDGYLGSGAAIQQAVKEYGLQNFSKGLLEFFSSFGDMGEGGRKLITDDVLRDPKCYNLRPGGQGNFNHINSQGVCRQHTLETRKKISQASKSWTESHREQFQQFIKKGHEAFAYKLRTDADFKKSFVEGQRLRSKNIWSKRTLEDRELFSKKFQWDNQKNG